MRATSALSFRAEGLRLLHATGGCSRPRDCQAAGEPRSGAGPAHAAPLARGLDLHQRGDSACAARLFWDAWLRRLRTLAVWSAPRRTAGFRAVARVVPPGFPGHLGKERETMSMPDTLEPSRSTGRSPAWKSVESGHRRGDRGGAEADLDLRLRLDHGFRGPLRIEKLRNFLCCGRAPPAIACTTREHAERHEPRPVTLLQFPGAVAIHRTLGAGAQRNRPLRDRRRPQRLAPAAPRPAARAAARLHSPPDCGAAPGKVRDWELSEPAISSTTLGLESTGFSGAPTPGRSSCGNISRWPARRSCCCTAACRRLRKVAAFSTLIAQRPHKGPTK